ncbi:hypothetical protein [Catenulispora subtropica]|uniref:hypothetical protein n=1 Tax=Catenulispora subtropica TaxID=450798 RepID=UPI0031D45E01
MDHGACRPRRNPTDFDTVASAAVPAWRRGPWTRWLALLFQVMRVSFLVGGYRLRLGLR